MLNIAILGCGYVGSALAEYLSKKGHRITGSTRSHSKAKKLKSICQKVQIVHSDDKQAVQELIRDQDIVIVSIGADSLEDYAKVYLNTARVIRNIALDHPFPKSLIYFSSTFVYGDHKGRWVDEAAKLLNSTDQGKILIESEDLYHSLEKLGWNVIIFRLSEIYGPSREISARVKKYEGSCFPGTGTNYTNMIHLDDIIFASDYAIKHSLFGTFNLADDDHLTRQELYDQIAEKFHFKKICFNPKIKTLRAGNKRVSNHKIKSSGYSFIHPHREITS